MQAMRSEIYFQQVRERSKISGDDAVVQHFLSAVLPGAQIAAEISRKIGKSASLHA
jgi:hypothetical protein